MVQEAAHDLAGTAAVVQIDTRSNPRLADRFGITSIPALLLFKRGKVIASITGALDRHALLAWWRSHDP